VTRRSWLNVSPRTTKGKGGKDKERKMGSIPEEKKFMGKTIKE